MINSLKVAGGCSRMVSGSGERLCQESRLGVHQKIWCVLKVLKHGINIMINLMLYLRLL